MLPSVPITVLSTNGTPHTEKHFLFCVQLNVKHLPSLKIDIHVIIS